MRENFKIIILAAAGIFMSLLCITWSFNQAPATTTTRTNASTQSTKVASSKPTLTLALNPQVSQVQLGEVIEISVDAITTTKASGIDIFLTYDNQYFEFVKAIPGNFFNEPKELTKKTETNTILYSLGAFTPSNLNGKIASFSFRAKKEGTTSIGFKRIETQSAPWGEGELSVVFPAEGKYTILK